ncbi:MAG: tripartite tricarboxylate transporter substrate binding protein [Oscillospiraceae bacterium]|jgi:tripartite-type tricarboxylate transporter receptor subunit TctC|nr:tripartite tricarboxylate transporter substrate binding protein [Oscillospiraceae bacterium]
MRKKLAMLLALVVILSLTACGAGASPAAGSGNAASGGGETDWPTETVTMVLPYDAGGDTDTYCRQMSLMLQEELGVNFVVVNTTGGSGVVAASSVMTAKNDGYTALFHHTGVMLTQEAASSNEFSFYDDFDVVATVARDDTYALIAKADSQWTTLEDMIAWAKANPGQLRYSVTYFGATHAVATLMESAMEIEMNQLDVGASTADRLTAFMADQCDVLVVNYMNIDDYVENGDFVVLGICADERPVGLEDFPTLKEQGYDVVQSKIYEVRLPKGTDPAIAEKLSAAIKKVTTSQEYADILATYYAQPYYRDAATTIAEDQAEVTELKTLFAE